MIQANTGLTWRSGQTVDDYNVLAYDQQFISDHFSNFDDLAGVFTLNKVNIETQKKLDQLAKDKDQLLGDLSKRNESIDQKKQAREGLKGESQTRMMRLTESVRKKFDSAMTGKKIAKTFCPEVEKKQPVEHTEDEIMEFYAVAYGKSAQTYPSLKKSNEYPGKYDLSGASYLGQPIVSTSDTQFARVMENFQPVMLNAVTDGRMWAENGVHLEKILKRNEKTHEGSEELWNYMYEHFILPNVKKGRIKE